MNIARFCTLQGNVLSAKCRFCPQSTTKTHENRAWRTNFQRSEEICDRSARTSARTYKSYIMFTQHHANLLTTGLHLSPVWHALQKPRARTIFLSGSAGFHHITPLNTNRFQNFWLHRVRRGRFGPLRFCPGSQVVRNRDFEQIYHFSAPGKWKNRNFSFFFT